jgi:hypothetical protein
MKVKIILQHLGKKLNKKGKPPLDGLPFRLVASADDGKIAAIIGNHLMLL